MTKLVNRAKMTTATTGTGTITLGSAVDGYQTFAAAGVADADVVRYVIEDGDAWEIGLGTYTASGTTLTRGSIESSNADNALNLTGNAVVYVSAAAADLQELVDFADNFVLPTADGSTGQVLTTNGAGTLSFTTISGYTDADVDTHLNTSTASSGEVLSWTGTDYDWVTVSSGATDINGLSDGYSDGSSVGLGSGALANDDGTTNRNTAVGWESGNAVTSGANNTFFGYRSGYLVSTGSGNTAVGWGSLDTVTTTSGNTAIGQSSGGVYTGSDSTFVGREAGGLSTTGIGQVLVGRSAGLYSTTGLRNIAVGQEALHGSTVSNLTGSYNIGVGYQTGYDLSTGAYNFLGGFQAGANLTTAANTVFIGQQAGFSATSDSLSVGIGYRALYNLTGGGTSTAPLVAIGREAMLSATGANYDSVAVGSQALKNMTSGYQNTAIGGFSGATITTGIRNTVVGKGFGGAGALTTGSNNTLLGYQAAPSSATVSNEITLGNSSITNLRVPGVGFQFDTTDGLIVPKTITAGGTTGAQTINKTAGSVNFAAAATSLVVTNSFVDANSVIIATVATNDTTMTSVRAVAAAGSFTLYANAAATAETRVNWFVAN